jgi:hypothetical protein
MLTSSLEFSARILYLVGGSKEKIKEYRKGAKRFESW